jgi:preprotein translocase subunit SecF
MSRVGALGNRLYRGDVQYDFVGRRRRWFAISGLIVVICGLSLVVKGLNFGVEFTGGSVFQVVAPNGSVDEARKAVSDAGVTGAEVTVVNGDRYRIQTEALTVGQRAKVVASLSSTFNVSPDQVDVQFVGPSWGTEITKKALTGLVLFLILVVLFLWVYFELKMAIAALVALVHDVLITVGVYSLLGIEVTPATVIGVLTILGYSLYDTVVVFDKVRENTKGIAGGSKMTYSEAANLAVNQTLVRSINTSVVALLPVIAILVGAVTVIGAGTLEQLGVALLVGIAAGTYSSIFIATPLLADLKEREPAMQALAKRVEQRRSGAASGRKGAGKKAKGAGVPDVDATETVDADSDVTAVGVSASSAPKQGATGPRNQPKGKKRSGGKRR